MSLTVTEREVDLLHFEMSSQTNASAAKETIDCMLYSLEQTLSLTEICQVLYDMSQLLNTKLDRETLVLCIQLIENGVNPEALAVR
jgi:hypothetical protein